MRSWNLDSSHPSQPWNLAVRLADVRVSVVTIAWIVLSIRERSWIKPLPTVEMSFCSTTIAF